MSPHVFSKCQSAHLAGKEGETDPQGCRGCTVRHYAKETPPCCLGCFFFLIFWSPLIFFPVSLFLNDNKTSLKIPSLTGESCSADVPDDLIAWLRQRPPPSALPPAPALQRGVQRGVQAPSSPCSQWVRKVACEEPAGAVWVQASAWGSHAGVAPGSDRDRSKTRITGTSRHVLL